MWITFHLYQLQTVVVKYVTISNSASNVIHSFNLTNIISVFKPLVLPLVKPALVGSQAFVFLAR